MTTVVVTHAIGNMATWLAGGEERAALFGRFAKSYKVFTAADISRACIVFEDVDFDLMNAALAEPATAEAKARHTVIDPLAVYVEVAGGK